ncbi:hypothetical protein [Halegenticoccus tardaugens]|uniref:hypothetical protein n=1 Tax=Halegenticoccus tardaugens TaxID=2071624 RepID=UPI0011B85EFD|nr:hypothetical protein [Halegenticoccus tardaugens]
MSLEHVLCGLHIDTGTTTTCTECDRELTECDPVTIRLHQNKQDTRWHLAACYCLGCAPTSFEELPPTLGTQLLCEGRIGITQDDQTQQTWPILVSPTIIETTRRTHVTYHATQEVPE